MPITNSTIGSIFGRQSILEIETINLSKTQLSNSIIAADTASFDLLSTHGELFFQIKEFDAKKQKGSPLAERFYQIQSRRGPQKATVALAHQLLKIAYILLQENLTYQEFIAQQKTTRDELVA